jgi:hypothetical protein
MMIRSLLDPRIRAETRSGEHAGRILEVITPAEIQVMKCYPTDVSGNRCVVFPLCDIHLSEDEIARRAE